MVSEDKLKWCFEIKKGLKLTEPNENLSGSYMDQAENALKRASELIEKEDLLWASVTIYYADYYALCSFLHRIGVDSENHDCSIALIEYLLGEDLETIRKHKENRVDAQYYMEINKKENINKMLKSAKRLVAEFNKKVISLGEQGIDKYREEVKELKKK